MKKVIIMLAAALAFAACSKVEINKPNHDSLISFQTAQYLTKAVTGTVFPTTETFGTYAWTAGTTGEYFMNNVKVAFASNAWNPVTPYYWPKDQTVDFFSYYPYGMQGLTVGKDTIRYAGIDFAANQMDIMYADKAVGYYDNDDDVDDGVNAYKGVPTYFRHAGCKVKFVVVLGYDKKIDTTHTATGIDSTITKWEVTLKGATLSGIYTRGGCELVLSSPDNGVIAWNKPASEVWTPDGTVNNTSTDTKFKNVREYSLKANTGEEIFPYTYMLPQTLVANQQKIDFVFDVKTYRKAPGESEFTLTMTQYNLPASASLISSDIPAWKMNHAITYTINIGPASNPITFDPAICDWAYENVSTNVELDI